MAERLDHRLFVARHGQSTYNDQRRITGRLDADLSARGREQARRLAELLSGTPLHAVFASPLIRARLTAEPLARHKGLDVQIVDGLMERDFGCFQGHYRQRLDAAMQAEWDEWRSNGMRGALGGGETSEELERRVVRALDPILAAAAGSSVLLVAHRHVNRAVLRLMLGLEYETALEIRAGNKYVYELVWKAAMSGVPESAPSVTTWGLGSARHGRRWSYLR